MNLRINGQVILSNGTEIPVQQYIEEVLLWQVQSKYNGDINQILYNTTKQNKGIVNCEPKKLQETLLQLRKQTMNYTKQSPETLTGKGK